MAASARSRGGRRRRLGQEMSAQRRCAVETGEGGGPTTEEGPLRCCAVVASECGGPTTRRRAVVASGRFVHRTGESVPCYYVDGTSGGNGF